MENCAELIYYFKYTYQGDGELLLVFVKPLDKILCEVIMNKALLTKGPKRVQLLDPIMFML